MLYLCLLGGVGFCLWLSSVMYVTWHGALLLGLCFTQGLGQCSIVAARLEGLTDTGHTDD